MSLKVRFFNGALTGTGGYVVKVLLNLFLIPFIIQYLGAEYFGFHMFLVGLSELIATIDLGLTAGLIHRLGEHHSRGDTDKYAEQLSIGHLLYLALGVLMLCAGLLALPLLPLTFKLTPRLEDIAAITFLLMLLDACFSLYGSYYRALLMSHSLYQWTNLSDVLKSILTNVTSFILLMNGFGLVEIFASRLGVTLLANLFIYAQSLRQEPLLKRMKPTFTVAGFRDLFEVSFHSLVLKVCLILSSKVDTLVIGANLGMAAVGTYSLVYSMLGQISYVSSKILEGVFPVFNRLTALSREREAGFVLLRLSCLINFVITSLLMAVVVYYPEIFHFLAKNKIRHEATWPVVWAMVPLIWSIGLMMPASSYLFVKRHFKYQTALNATAFVANLMLSLLLVKPFGLVGVAVGSLIPHFIEQQVFIIPHARRELGIGLMEYVKTVHLKNILPCLAGLAVLEGGRFLTGAQPALGLFVAGGAFALASWVWYAHAASDFEREFLRERFLASTYRKLEVPLKSGEPV